MTKEIITKGTGAKVKFSEVDFLTANKLKSILTKSAKNQGYKLSELDAEKTIEVLDCNKEVVDILFECLKRCSYDGEKITVDIFEDPKRWADYYEIMLTCLEVNYTPFFVNPSSLSKTEA